MTILELKKIIEELPDDMLVLMTAYENGLTQVDGSTTMDVFTYPQGKNSSVYGEFIKKDNMCFKESTCEKYAIAFVIERDLEDIDIDE